MKELFIHIGVHKTGSSAIQHFMDNNREVLLKKYNLYYPEVTGDRHCFQHNYFTRDLKKGNSSRINKFLEIAAKKSNRILLSSESFSGADTIPNSLKSIKDSFDRIKIIAYLRRQDLWLESIYRQFVKNESYTINDVFNVWVDKYLAGFNGIYSCDWIELLAKWSNVFGAENIIVRPYEKSQFFGGSLINDFLNTLEINYNSNDFSDNIRTYNKSFNLEATDFLRLMNNSSGLKRWRSSLNTLFTDPYHVTGEVYLTYEKRQKIMARFQSSNIKVIKTFLPENKELFIEPLPGLEDYPRVFQGLDKQEIIPKIESLVKDLENAVKQLNQQMSKKTNSRFSDIFKTLIGKH